MIKQTLGPVSPFFIVRDALESARYYVDALGFEMRLVLPEDKPFFAIVGRDSVQLFVKAISDTVLAQPNSTRHEWAPWDAFVYSKNPLSLQEEFDSRGAFIHKRVHTRDDGLTGLEVRDLDGYVLYFGSPD